MASGNLPSPSSDDPHGGRAWSFRLTESDEAELLALVEGRLTAGQERLALARWQDRPEVMAFVEGAIRDRLMVAALPEVEAPGGLLNGVEALLERELLVGESDDPQVEFSSGSEHGTLVSSRPPRVPSLSGRRPWTAPAFKYAAMAAMLVLAAVVTMRIVGPAGSSTQGATIALDATGPAEKESAGPASVALADAATDMENPAPASVALSDERAAPAGAHAESTAQESGMVAQAQPADPSTWTADRALSLAREGRLMVRVVTGNVGRAVDRVRRGEDRRLAETVTAVDASPADSDLIAAVAEAVRPLEFRASPFDAADQPDHTYIASGKSIERPSLRQATPSLERRDSPRRAVTRVDLPLSIHAIETLRNALGTRGSIVELVELADPLPAQPAFHPEQALWWTQPPSAWTPVVGVPVVFEQP